MATHSSILPCKSPGQGGLEGYSPWGGKESDLTVHEPPYEGIILFPLGVYPEMELLNQRVSLCLIFEESPNYFLQHQYHFTFPIAMYKDSSFSTSLLIIVTFLLNIHKYIFYTYICVLSTLYRRCEVISQCGCDLHKAIFEQIKSK